MFARTCSFFAGSYYRHINATVNRTLFNKIPSEDPEKRKKIKSTLNYVTAVGVLALGLTYAAVPLYRIFCQVHLYIISKFNE